MESATLESLVSEVEEEVIGYRRRLHGTPELSFEEAETARFVYDTLQSFGGFALSRPTGTSVVARLTGTAPGEGKTLALRADMDALPIQEETDLPFASSRPGVMHACGHDGHTAMLLGAAKALSEIRDRIAGEVRFVFQHAEELFPGGAEELVAAGAMDGVDAVIGAHLWAPLQTGNVGVGHGPMMAAPDTFRITVHGSGGHAANPHQTVDSIAVGAQVVTNLQHVVARNTDPIDNLVVSVTKFAGGTADNVIPGSVELTGTVRSFDPELRETTPETMERIVRGVTAAHGASYEFEYRRGYRPVVNDEEVTRLIEETVREEFGEEALDYPKPVMGGEDFSAYQQRSPGTFFYVGAGGDAAHPHHHPSFDIDERALPIGVRTFVGATLKLLGRE